MVPYSMDAGRLVDTVGCVCRVRELMGLRAGYLSRSTRRIFRSFILYYIKLSFRSGHLIMHHIQLYGLLQLYR